MSVGFLADYETANSAIKRFREEFPSGDIIPNHVKDETDLAKGYITVRTEIYRDSSELRPAAVDYAYGNVAFYPENMKKWFVEDTVTSSISRAIKLLSPSGESRSSFEDMQRVEKLAVVPFPKSLDDGWTPTEVKHVSNAMDDLAGELISGGRPGDKECQHGVMIRKEGISQKTGNPYKGWTCPSKNKDFQCKAIWEN
jgi:hypothetical protein